MWSPRTRGWSRLSGLAHPDRGGGPRARGGGPNHLDRRNASLGWSPRTRGWSRLFRGLPSSCRVVPAHAGVVPMDTAPIALDGCGPRRDPRGDGRHAWSPRTRGWSPALRALAARRVVVPAHAGVVPPARRRLVLPRRGPRARGGGPVGAILAENTQVWSPRTRGWSRCGATAAYVHGVVPAHAGVVPVVRERPRGEPGGPRARGGGPACLLGILVVSAWSPRTRGWSRAVHAADRLGQVVPAHAGVVPWPASR